MNKPLKELIDCMQKGWDKLPRNSLGMSYSGPYSRPTAACPLVHAILGKTGEIGLYEEAKKHFPILDIQQVAYNDRFGNDNISLKEAIVNLADVHRWSTPFVIEWLKSHLRD